MPFEVPQTLSGTIWVKHYASAVVSPASLYVEQIKMVN